ncbi:tRNA pseudouridine(55) synthase TruB [Candidatus Uhrbacteria bacterium]|nr:tRNA pseudouridine(55) synthase TruB [Candidatus Uhrbacteria bacterium]
MNGFLLINKPAGPTSHDIVDEVRKIFKIRKVGHAGTLDPFAGGLLIIGIGKATKELAKIQGLPKTYSGTMAFGVRSTTDDPEGIITESGAPLPKKEEVEIAFKKFVGKINQVPPIYSAKKINGKKLYEIARAGGSIEIPPVRVTIKSLNLLEYGHGLARFETTVSSGTYIRALARDIGNMLGVGGYLKELERTRIGDCSLKDAVNMANLRENPTQYLIPELKCATLNAD